MQPKLDEQNKNKKLSSNNMTFWKKKTWT